MSAVPAIAEIPGVLGKLFLSDADSSRCAGIYTFTGRAAAEDYLGSDLFQGAIATNPAIANLRTRASELPPSRSGPSTAASASITTSTVT